MVSVVVVVVVAVVVVLECTVVNFVLGGVASCVVVVVRQFCDMQIHSWFSWAFIIHR